MRAHHSLSSTHLCRSSTRAQVAKFVTLQMLQRVLNQTYWSFFFFFGNRKEGKVTERQENNMQALPAYNKSTPTAFFCTCCNIESFNKGRLHFFPNLKNTVTKRYILSTTVMLIADQSFLPRHKDQKAGKFLTLKILSGWSRLKYEQMVGFPDIASTGSTGRKSQSIWTRFTAAPHLQPTLLTAALQGLCSVALQCTVSTRIARRAECKVEVSLIRAPGRIFFFFFCYRFS